MDIVVQRGKILQNRDPYNIYIHITKPFPTITRSQFCGFDNLVLSLNLA